MKLDRNGPGTGKYAVVRLRALRDEAHPVGEARQALETLREGGFATMGMAGADDEFFVVMLKDKYAYAALRAYAAAAADDGEVEYANDVKQLAMRAAKHPHRKKPD